MTILSEDSPGCGQSGRVRRVFWRDHSPWVVISLPRTGMLALPWAWTNLPVPAAPAEAPGEETALLLLTPAALRDLLRFAQDRCLLGAH